jgi:hypothetical protein
MASERDDWGYYVRAIRDLTHPPSEAGGFSTYEAARFAGNAALVEFLERLEREKLRSD